jgi:hypothetical protein
MLGIGGRGMLGIGGRGVLGIGGRGVLGGCRIGSGVAAVALLEEVQIGADAKLIQSAGDTRRPQIQGTLLDVLPGREGLVGGKLAGDHPAVTRGLPEPADLSIALGRFLLLADAFRVELEDQLARCMA